MKKTLIALIHPDEWNQYIPFNGYLSSIKHDYKNIIGVVSENAISLISEADEYFTIKNDNLKNLGYPQILETKHRANHDFINKCTEEILKSYSKDEIDIISWQPTKYHKGILTKNLVNTHVYIKTFEYAQKWYKTGKLIYPTEETYSKIKNKYGHLFANDDVYVLISRNFKNKARANNTHERVPNFKEMITHLVSNNIKIINIGFPPSPCEIESDNYIEIDDRLTQDELISIFYMAKGVLLPADSSGFVSHYASNADIFTITNQWGLPGYGNIFDIISTKTKEVPSVNLAQLIVNNNFDEIENILKNHKRIRKNVYTSLKKITFVE